MQGTIMKITEKCIVVLCQDGTFRNLPLPAELPKLGESINVDLVHRPQRLGRHRFKSSMWVAAASILLIIGAVVLLNSFTGTKQPLTLVAVDINPSVELWVDQEEKIKEVELINDDAKLLVSEQDLEGKPIYEALGLIIGKAEQGGYLDSRSNKKWVWITVVPPRGMETSVLTIDRNKLPAFKKDYSLEVFTANQALVEQAKKANLTINKYVVYRQAHDQGIDMDMAKLRTHSIVSVLASVGVEPETLFKDEVNPSVEQQSGEMSGAASKQGTESVSTRDLSGGNSEGVAGKQSGKEEVQPPAVNQGGLSKQKGSDPGKSASKVADGVSKHKANGTATVKKNNNNISESSAPSAEAGSKAAANGYGARTAEKKPLSQQAVPKTNTQPVKKNDKKLPENGQTKNDSTSLSQEPAKGNGSASDPKLEKGQGNDPTDTSESINHETAKPHNNEQNKPVTETGKETEPAESKSNDNAGESSNSSQNQAPVEHHTPSDHSGGGGHKTK